MNRQRWQDWATLVFGAWLFASPFWLMGYASGSSIGAWNSYFLGVLVVVFAWAAIATGRRWEEWLELAFAAWLIISPAVLGFYHSEYGAAWNQIALGILIGVDSLWALAASSARRQPVKT